MIGFLRGNVLSVESSFLVLEVNGVGYEVFVTGSLLANISQKKDPLSLWIYTGFRQDALELYGFSSLREKKLFLSLLKVNGIGPKMALSILGSCSLDQFIQIIQKEDIKALMALPKVGKKTAGQIFLTLKGEVIKELFSGDEKVQGYGQVVSALQALGFNTVEIQWAFKQMQWEGHLEKDLKKALYFLNQRQSS